MAYNALNNLIDAYIYANGVQAITGQILNGVLKQMVSQLGSGYHLMGVATPQTVPATDDYAMAYFAATAGEYTDFGGITLAAGEVAVLLTSGNGSWSKQTIYNIPTGTADLENTAEFITNAVTDLVNYYTKTEIDTTLADYPTLEDLATALADYYTKTEIDTILADYTTNTALASALADYYNKNDIDGLLSVVNAALADRYTKDETDTKLADYYKKTETYDKDEVDSIVATLSRQEYIVAWDGSSAPDVTAIPAGVTVTYSGTTYTGTLAASASTVNKIYMVWNGTAYDMYGTSQDGGYSWVPMGTTTVDLSQYATKAEVSQLEAKVTEKTGGEYAPIMQLEQGAISSTTGENSASTTRLRTANYISADAVYLTISGNKAYVFGYKEDGTFVGKTASWVTASREVRITDAKKYRICFAFSNDATINVSDFSTLGIVVTAIINKKSSLLYSFGVIEGVYVNVTSGGLTENANRNATDYIDISEFNRLVYTKLVTTGSAAAGLCFYDTNKAFISGVQGEVLGSNLGYVVEEAEIPAGAVYARFSLWKNPYYGEFFFADPTRDGNEKRLEGIIGRLDNLETFAGDIQFNQYDSLYTKFDGNGVAVSYGEQLHIAPYSVLKIKIKNTNLPSPATEGQAKFLIESVDENEVSTFLVRVNGDETISSEYTVIVPSNSEYVRIGGRLDDGYSFIAFVENLSGRYNSTKKATAKDITQYTNNQQYNRAEMKTEITKNSVISVIVLNPEIAFEYQITRVKVNNDHTITSNIACPWSKSSNVFIADDDTYCRLQVRKTDGTVITDADIVTFLGDVEIYTASVRDEIANEYETVAFWGKSTNMTSGSTSSEFIVQPKQGMTLLLRMPSWLRVKFKTGTRRDRVTSDYYYNGDEVSFEQLRGGLAIGISQLDGTGKKPEYYSTLIEENTLAFIIKDKKDKSVIERNFDAEKYLGAIRATPNVYPNLPLFVHTSDIHGDYERFGGILDYADYIGADCVINTGDNPFYVMSDGVNFHKELVLSHKSDFAVCLGNHDTYVEDGTTQDIYDKCIAPFAEQYGYEKDGGDVTDKCYFFKDLDNQKIRIIALDIYEGFVTANYKARVSSTQMDWFIDTLSSTPAGYGVLVILHQAPHFVSAIQGKTNFNDTTMDSQLYSIDSDYMSEGKIIGNPFGKIIDSFIGRTTVSGTYTQKKADLSEDETIAYTADFTNVAEGVEFIAYLNGHCHRDFIGCVDDCEHAQLNLNVASASPISQSTGDKTPSDIMRDSNGSNQDAFNIYTINRTDKTVGIARIGANLSKDLRPRTVMFVRYADE